jgi:hypothetical protein
MMMSAMEADIIRKFEGKAVTDFVPAFLLE